MDMNVTNPKTNAEQAALACRDMVVNALKPFICFMALAHVTTLLCIHISPAEKFLTNFFFHAYQDGCVFGADVQVYCADADSHKEIDQEPEPVIPKVP